MSTAAILLAAAVLLTGAPRRRPAPRPRSAVVGPLRRADPLAVASSLDVFAACLDSGMTVAGAAEAAGASAPRPLAHVLVRAANLLVLGADPARAWADPDSGDATITTLTRSARRSAASGAALARSVSDLAEQSRHDATSAARAAAERAAVLIAGPLGLCYLPAFVCLGIVPVVIGLAGDVLTTGVP